MFWSFWSVTSLTSHTIDNVGFMEMVLEMCQAQSEFRSCRMNITVSSLSREQDVTKHLKDRSCCAAD